MRKDSRTHSLMPARRSLTVVKRPMVLYVEDDDDNWDVAQLRLGHAYELVRAVDDREACAILRMHHHEIACVLMDIELRDSVLNGAELTELMRGNPLPTATAIPSYARGLPPISQPIFFVTAHGARYSDVQLMLFGADKVISKPVNFDALELALADCRRLGSALSG